MEPGSLPFIVEVWSTDGRDRARVLSRSCNVSIARGAFDKAVRMYGDRGVITLRDGARIVERHPEH